MKMKFLSIVTCMFFITAQFMPIAFAVNSETQNEIDESETIEKTKENENIENTNDEKVEKITEIIESNETDNNKSENEIQNVENIENENTEVITLSFDVNGNKINSYLKDEINYLFVPKGIDLSELDIDYTGNIEAIDNAEFNEETKKITGTFQNNSELIITLKDGQTETVKIMQSDVPAIYIDDLIATADNQPKTIEEVNSGSKNEKYNATVMVTGCDNNKSNISQIAEFKGRGNTSWRNMPKKGYQIKLNKKANFLEIGDSKEKKWVLIANYQDPTLLKNKIMNDLCVKSKLSLCPNSSYADLYVDGNYIGNYLVCDKIEIKENRIPLKDDKGVLVEVDNAYYNEEDYYFTSKRAFYYTIKEFVNEEKATEAMDSFKNALNEFEDELYSENPSWDKITKMIDVESFAKYYLLDEFAENNDSYWTSTYMYKDGDNDLIHMGPTWDYDAAFAYCKGEVNGENPLVDFTLKYKQKYDIKRLYNFPQFAKLVNEIYIRDVKPNLDQIDVNAMSKEFEQSLNINTLVWSDADTYSRLKDELNNFVENRKEYFSTRYTNKQVQYSTHVENVGWTNAVYSGISGTEGRSLRLEGLSVSLGSGYEENMSISYKTHVQNIGWQDWVNDGELSGTAGQSLRLEAAALKLNNSTNYSVRYRVHVQNIGWTDWAYDGEIAGTEGQSLRLEAIEIEIVPKRDNFGSDDKNINALINYKGHIQNIGDTGYLADGNILGTIGRGLRLEGLKIELSEAIADDISLEIDEHIENIGWRYGLTDKDYLGTQGQALRIEALSFKVKGEKSENYNIRYRVHVQNIGWQDWKENGEIAGTEGQSLRIEAIQIELIEK